MLFVNKYYKPWQISVWLNASIPMKGAAELSLGIWMLDAGLALTMSRREKNKMPQQGTCKCPFLSASEGSACLLKTTGLNYCISKVGSKNLKSLFECQSWKNSVLLNFFLWSLLSTLLGKINNWHRTHSLKYWSEGARAEMTLTCSWTHFGKGG